MKKNALWLQNSVSSDWLVVPQSCCYSLKVLSFSRSCGLFSPLAVGQWADPESGMEIFGESLMKVARRKERNCRKEMCDLSLKEKGIGVLKVGSPEPASVQPPGQDPSLLTFR